MNTLDLREGIEVVFEADGGFLYRLVQVDPDSGQTVDPPAWKETTEQALLRELVSLQLKAMPEMQQQAQENAQATLAARRKNPGTSSLTW